MLPKVPIAPYGLRAPSQGREHRTAPQRPTLVPTGGHVGAGQFEQAAWAAPPPARGPDCTARDTEDVESDPEGLAHCYCGCERVRLDHGQQGLERQAGDGWAADQLF